MKVNFIIPTLNRPSLIRAVSSAEKTGIPFLVEWDTLREGAGPTRNKAINRCKTEWVAFLDDDDTVTTDYYYHFVQATKHNPDVIIFKARRKKEYRGMWKGEVFPKVNRVIRGNQGVHYAVKRKLAKKHPFIAGKGQDTHFLETLEKAGAKFHWSPAITYQVRH